MDRLFPYKRRIQRVLKISGKTNNVEKLINNYQTIIDDYLLLLYSKYLLRIDFKDKKIDYASLIDTLNQKYNLKLSSSTLLENADYSQLNKFLIEVVDLKEFNEANVMALRNELDWLEFDQIAAKNSDLFNKKAELFKKYKGNEQELFSLLRKKYSKKPNENKELYRKKLIALFQEYRPSKINQVDSLLTKYEGKEEEFINMLLLKFYDEKNQKVVLDNKRREEEEHKNEQAQAKIEADKAKQEEEAKSLQLAAESKRKAEEEEEEERLQSVSQSNLKPSNFRTEIWNGLKVPVIAAKSIKEASKIANGLVNELPTYNGKKIFKWNGKCYPLKIDDTPSKQKVSKSKKHLSKSNKILILSLTMLCVVAVLFYLFKDSIIPIQNQTSLNTGSEKKSEIKELVVDTIKVDQDAAVSINNETNNHFDSISNTNELETNDKITLEEPETNDEIQKTELLPKNNNLKYHLIAGSFNEKVNATDLVKELNNQGYDARFLGKVGEYYKVSYESFKNRLNAEKVRGEMIESGTFTWIQDFELKE